MLLDAAIEVVREQGPRASMEAMAAAGGVTKPILYRHFGDRAGLVTAIGEAFLHDLGVAISGALQQYGGSGGGAVLRAAMDAYLALIERDTELYRFLVQQDARLGSERTSAFVAQVIEQVTGLVEAGLQAIGRSPQPAELWAVGIVGMVHAAGDWWAERRTTMDRATVVDELTGLLWDGLGAPAPTTSR
jgi:AcrR family transcriptional regulator